MFVASSVKLTMLGTKANGIPHDADGNLLGVLSPLLLRAASQTKRGVNDEELSKDASVSGVVDTMTIEGPSLVIFLDKVNELSA